MTEAIQKKAATNDSSVLGEKSTPDVLNTAFERLNHGLIERNTEIRLAVLAALSGEHLLLVGPPGTAKSEIARRLVRAIGGEEVFERLLTRFSVPEELFGPLSLKALEDDRYERKTEKYLPTARVAFIDEIFKANSAILNSLLTILNERRFDNGSERVDVPLVTLVGASNELPEGEELQALYDRFLLRRQVLPVSDDGFLNMLALNDDVSSDEGGEPILPLSFLKNVQAEAARVFVPKDVAEFIGAMREYLAKEKIYVSDRRWRKALKLLKVAAYTNGQDQVTIWECKLLEHCLWNDPQEQETIRNWYDGRIGIASDESAKTGHFERLTAGLEQQLFKQQRAQSQVQDAEGNPLYLNEYGKASAEIDPKNRFHKKNGAGELLYFAPEGTDERTAKKEYSENELLSKFGQSYNNQIRIPSGRSISLSQYIQDENNQVLVSPQLVMEPSRYSVVHIEGKQKEVAGILSKASEYIERLESELENIKDRITAHLWLDTSFGEIALIGLNNELERNTELKIRLDTVHKGFGELPREVDQREV